MYKLGAPPSADSPRNPNARRKLPTPPHGGTPRATTTHNATDDDGVPKVQADSSNLSYSSPDESDSSDGATSSLSFRIEGCSVELAKTFTIDDPLPVPSTSPKPANDDLDLLEFLAELTPRASPKPKVTPLLPTVHEIPPEARQTRQSHVRNSFASKKTQKITGLTVLPLPLPTTEETTTTSSQESSSPKFVPSSPRLSTTNSTSRVGYLRTPRSTEAATVHRRSESQGGKQSGKTETPGSERIVRPSARRTLDKTATRRAMPRVTGEKRTVDEVKQAKQAMEAWDELEHLADEIIAITSAGPLPLPTSITEDPSNPAKPPVKD